MNRFASPQRSVAVAAWLFTLAGLVVLMVLVGGATRLTQSGLSITEWKPLNGVIPPMSPTDWSREFAHYQQIPQYRLLNHNMSLAAFKGIYWWEWWHRLIGRLVGLVFVAPFAWFALRRQIPSRLLWRCVVLFCLGGLQGLIGWWMVSSGLSERTSVAPERLATHLGTALVLLMALIWTGLEAMSGPDRVKPSPRWVWASSLILGLTYLQCLLGALVAGNHAGLVYNDWPLMNGKMLAPVDWRGGAGHALLHDLSLVQFDHRLSAYCLLAVVTLWGVQVWRRPMPEGLKINAVGMVGVTWLQAFLGVVTLLAIDPLWLALTHQAGALVVLIVATVTLWRVMRFEPRQFGGGIGSRAL